MFGDVFGDLGQMIGCRVVGGSVAPFAGKRYTSNLRFGQIELAFDSASLRHTHSDFFETQGFCAGFGGCVDITGVSCCLCSHHQMLGMPSLQNHGDGLRL